MRVLILSVVFTGLLSSWYLGCYPQTNYSKKQKSYKIRFNESKNYVTEEWLTTYYENDSLFANVEICQFFSSDSKELKFKIPHYNYQKRLERIALSPPQIDSLFSFERMVYANEIRGNTEELQLACRSATYTIDNNYSAVTETSRNFLSLVKMLSIQFY